ncbi:MAG TPA: AAA family ATPase, partial [Candidatus Sabulitectum sp.]|nr:AAA family ATPase [Candidatus Sabulitectum sp.]
MLTGLQVRNFKCWQDTDEIRLAPLTLFFGENSSGKSSISQLLMMLKQTMEVADRKAVCFPGNDRSAVQL